MATYTHTFEIIIAGQTIEGEVSWDSGTDVHVKINDGLEICIDKLKDIINIFDVLAKTCKDCGVIQKFELNIK